MSAKGFLYTFQLVYILVSVLGTHPQVLSKTNILGINSHICKKLAPVIGMISLYRVVDTEALILRCSCFNSECASD